MLNGARVINHGYTISAKEDGVLLAKNLEVKQSKSKLINPSANVFIGTKYK